MTPTYEEFVAGKLLTTPPVGIKNPPALSDRLFDFQKAIVQWALKRGRAAIFADCGMGKSAMQLEWARCVSEHEAGNVLILAPLAVASQTVREGEKFGIAASYARSQDDVKPGITVANYEMLHAFDADSFVGVVLDESSILKAYDGKTRTSIIEAFQHTPYRLACTATPAPNDHMELGNHSEFLGIMSRTEMLATFFCHDGGETQTWRLKGHAEKEFWRWVCSWAAMIRQPSDLGYGDDGFVLPSLEMHQHVVSVDQAGARAAGMLFAMEARTLQDQRNARRSSLEDRVAKCAAIVAKTDAPWLIWCELNDEGDALERAIPGAIQIKGADSVEQKESRMLGFTEGRIRVLVTKPSIAGFGMNWQHCANVAFVGVSHSYEQTYQAIRRCWRFGQKNSVNVHVISAETEGAVAANLARKERDAKKMADAMVAHMLEIQGLNIRASARESLPYNPKMRMNIPDWCFSHE